jgi:uncharacterized protein (TIGR02757 family)
LYRRYHRAEYIGSDPLLFVHRYVDPGDQEVVGLIASSLAYGNVTAINQSIARVLAHMGKSPRTFLLNSDGKQIAGAFAGFRHRWTGEEALADLMVGMRDVIRSKGGLGAAFLSVDEPEADIDSTLSRWVVLLRGRRARRAKELLSDPDRASACKRLHLYLRWMARRDVIDPGCWAGVSPSRLLMPLDTHVFQF